MPPPRLTLRKSLWRNMRTRQPRAAGCLSPPHTLVSRDTPGRFTIGLRSGLALEGCQLRMFGLRGLPVSHPRFCWNGQMAGSRSWGAADITSGPFDEVLHKVRAAIPDLRVERLVGTWPGDDDNLYWLQHAGIEVRVGTHPGGRLPVLVETDNIRLEPGTVEAAASLIIDLLGCGAD